MTQMNCKSLIGIKNKLNVNLKHKLQKQKIIVKIQFQKYWKDSVLHNTLTQRIKKNTFNCKSKSNFIKNTFNMKIRHSTLRETVKEFNICNNIILDRIEDFVELTKWYINFYNHNSYNIMIEKTQENSLNILEMLQHKIKSFEQYQSFTIQEIFNDQVLTFFERRG